MALTAAVAAEGLLGCLLGAKLGGGVSTVAHAAAVLALIMSVRVTGQVRLSRMADPQPGLRGHGGSRVSFLIPVEVSLRCTLSSAILAGFF